ncbi:ATP-binding cassette domain-containing protein [Nocardia sp. NPDC058176]|uniref:ATP-binding cassette domain-containing protein n=1 Tax=Nocardia sp. NPDC058176 TaxID=3346368 RepID=UPI0036DD932B
MGRQVGDPRWQVGALAPTAAAVLFRERWSLLTLLGSVPRGIVGGYVAVALVSVAAPVALALATAALIGDLRGGAAVGESFSIPVTAIVLGVVVVVAESAIGVRSALQWRLTEAVDGHVRAVVRRAAGGDTPFAVVASTAFQADVVRACDPGVTARNRTAGAACAGQLLLVFRFAGAVLGAVVLAVFDPVLAAGVLGAALVTRMLVRRQWIHLSRVQDDTITEVYERDAFATVVTDERAARELRVFGLGDWFIDRWTEIADRHRGRFTVEHLRVVRRQIVTTALVFVTIFAGFGIPGSAAAGGGLGLGALTACLVAVAVIFQIAAMGYEAFDIDYGLVAHRAYQRILATRAPEPTAVVPDPSASTAPIRFEAVSFSYPGSSRRVLRDLNLEIGAGQTLGLVGVNGAGKSTLTSLLTGLYPPTAGQITRAGQPYPPAGRGEVAVVTQNFLRYPLSLRENIRLALTDDHADDDLVWHCLEKAGLAPHLRDRGIALDDPVWSVTGAARIGLSGGQWQRLALARALFAAATGHSLVVLDEPTSQLDVDAELRFHEQVLSALAEVTVVLITHRLSTVRHVDRIVLLDGGHITEDGTHDELMAADGTYADLFRLQADRFGAVRA